MKGLSSYLQGQESQKFLKTEFHLENFVCAIPTQDPMKNSLGRSIMILSIMASFIFPEFTDLEFLKRRSRNLKMPPEKISDDEQ